MYVTVHNGFLRPLVDENISAFFHTQHEELNN